MSRSLRKVHSWPYVVDMLRYGCRKYVCVAANGNVALSWMSVLEVLSSQQRFDLTSGQVHREPALVGGVDDVRIINASIYEPVFDGLHSVHRWLEDLVHFFGGEVLAEAW
jgi:hypothetical protein